MTAASRSLATALWKARFASGLLRLSYTTKRDTTVWRPETQAIALRREDPRQPESVAENSR